MSINLEVSPLFRSIEAWWGEPLNLSLAQRIVAAPIEHLIGFADFCHTRVSGELTPLPPGELRPLFIRRNPDLSAHLKSAVHALLYAHKAAVEDPTPLWPDCGRAALEKSLNRLIELRPLAESGALQFVLYPHRLRHPSQSHALTSVNLEEVADLLVEGGEFDREMIRIRAIRNSDDLSRLIFRARTNLGLALRLALETDGRITVLAGSPEEAMLLPIGIRVAALTSPDMRVLHLQKLLALELPNLDSAAIAAVRRSSDDFALWRSNLTSALGEIEGFAFEDPHWRDKARALLEAELTPVRNRLQSAVDRSPALAAVKSGTLNVGYSGIGALTGALAGGRLSSALVGAGAGKSAEAVVAYLSALKARRHTRALLDVTMTFYRGD